MKIYTRTGDKGQTSLISGERVPKSHHRVDAYGTLDELNSFLGLLRSELKSHPQLAKNCDDLLVSVQNEIFQIGTHVANINPTKVPPLPLNPKLVQKLEQAMDTMDIELPKLTNFILPGGHILSSYAHVLRTICRRAERKLIELNQTENEKIKEDIVVFINRLSDYFFVLARFLNFKLGVTEVIWNSK